jgi:hypothetical protein
VYTVPNTTRVINVARFDVRMAEGPAHSPRGCGVGTGWKGES